MGKYVKSLENQSGAGGWRVFVAGVTDHVWGIEEILAFLLNTKT